MDEYLIQNANFDRLLKEYHSFGSLVIAFDFDNTIYDFHKKGHSYPRVIQLLRDLKSIGCELICFTANDDYDLIRTYCKEQNIPLDKINENPSFFKGTCGKIYFNALLDDRAGLIQTYNELSSLVRIIKSITINVQN